MMKFSKVIAIFLLVVSLTRADGDYEDEANIDEQKIYSRSFLRKFGVCVHNGDCLEDEYCDYQKNQAINRCVRKGFDRDYCLYDVRCLSNHCHNFKCKGLQVGKNVEPNGPCNDNEDCRFEQYCKNKKCTDRIEYGSCSNDDQCLSNHCTFWKKCDNRILKSRIKTNNF